MKARTSERDSVRKLKARGRQSPEPPQVPRAEWDFSSCPKDESFECDAYEFARETAAIREDVRSLRKGIGRTFDDLVSALPERIDRTPRGMALFWYCPEFPHKPYLAMPTDERQRRLRTLWPYATASLAIKPKIGPPRRGATARSRSADVWFS
jgi:hypothetical protein